MEFATNHYIISICWLVTAGMLVYSFFGASLRGYSSASSATTTQLINREQAVVLDIREENDYLKGHIVNSIHIPVKFLANRIGELDKYKGKPIIVSCRSGQQSGQACAMLKKQGFENVYSLSGGMMAWQNDNLPLTKK